MTEERLSQDALAFAEDGGIWDKEAESGNYLEILHLAPSSTADDVRRAAISMRAQMREKGLNADSVKALQWALWRTNDCQTDEDFLGFLLQGWTFEEIEDNRTY